MIIHVLPASSLGEIGVRWYINTVQTGGKTMNVTLSLTVDEVNYILGALGQCPFAEVLQLIFKIKQDAESQLTPAPTLEEIGRASCRERV